MQLRMINVLNKILSEKKKLLNDIDEKVCEHCGVCHDDLEECTVEEQSTTASVAMPNPPLSSDSLGGITSKKNKMKLKDLLNTENDSIGNTYKKYYIQEQKTLNEEWNKDEIFSLDFYSMKSDMESVAKKLEKLLKDINKINQNPIYKKQMNRKKVLRMFLSNVNDLIYKMDDFANHLYD